MLLAACAYAQIRKLPETSDFARSLPAREATLEIKITRVLQQSNGYGYSNGMAEVVNAASSSRLAIGSEIYYSLRTPESAEFSILPGLVMEATGVLKPIHNDLENIGFDAYLRDIGINYRFERLSALKQIKPASALERFYLNTNEKFEQFLKFGAPEESELSNIYVAMLLGKKTELTSNQSDRFRMSGTMHFFAISGLHIGIIASVIAQFLLLIRVPRRYSPLFGLPLLYLYVEISGGAPSAIRAFLMAACFWISIGIMRQRSPFGALIASAILVLIIDPAQLFSIGFQLSYIVVLSILLFGLPLHQVMLKRYSPFQLLPESDWSSYQRCLVKITDKVILMFAISLSAWLASAPLCAGIFGYIAPSAILLNMLLVNFVALIICSGIIAIGLSILGLTGAAAFLNHAAWLLIQLIDSIVTTSLLLPKSVIQCDAFSPAISYLAVAGFFTLIAWLQREPSRLQSKQILLPPIFTCSMITFGVSLSLLEAWIKF